MLNINVEDPEALNQIAITDIPLLMARSGYKGGDYKKCANAYIIILAEIVRSKLGCTQEEALEEVKHEIGYNAMNLNKTEARQVRDFFGCENPIVGTNDLNSEDALKVGIEIGHWIKENPSHTYRDLKEFAVTARIKLGLDNPEENLDEPD